MEAREEIAAHRPDRKAEMAALVAQRLRWQEGQVHIQRQEEPEDRAEMANHLEVVEVQARQQVR